MGPGRRVAATVLKLNFENLWRRREKRKLRRRSSDADARPADTRWRALYALERAAAHAASQRHVQWRASESRPGRLHPNQPAQYGGNMAALG